MIWTTTRRIGLRLLAPIVACVTLAVTACGVENPGAILDSDLNDELVLQALVSGMSGDLSAIVDELAFDIARGSDEMAGSGSYFETGLLRRGIINREDQNFEFGGGHRARWVAEAGIERMDSILGDNFSGNRLVARAFLLAGLSNRLLGETVCYVVIDGSPAMSHTVHFDSAIVRAASAISHGQTAGEDDIVTAAHGVQAQARLGLGDFAGAAAAAAQVPTDFVYEAIYSNNSGREENVIYNETHRRAEMSAFGTLAGSFSPNDPRAPWLDCGADPQPFGCNSAQGADGSTRHYQQMKYPDYGTNIPVVKGTEMRLIEAEAALVGGDVTGAMAKMNEVRTYHGLAALTAADAAEAWTHLDNERHLTLWLEGRRFFDLRRWDAAGRTDLPGVQFVYGLTNVVYDKDSEISKRATCIPISLAECQTNPNLLGAPECAGSN